MKKILFILTSVILAISFISCNSQGKSDAVKQVIGIQKMIKENSPGYTSTSADYYMKAKINGKSWSADEMMASDEAGRIVGKTDGESISLPFELRYVKTGANTNFKNHAVDIFMNDDVGIWGGTIGEMEYTKVGDKYAEGRFYVTGTSTGSSKQLIITEGTFRIPLGE
jgi:hypothetical protein